MRRVIGPSALLLLIGCAASRQSASPTPRPADAASSAVAEKGVRIRVPPWVGGFGMASRQDYPDPSAGVALRYTRPDSMVADVFVYPGPDLTTDCARACAQRVMDEEIAVFRASFPAMIQRGYVRSIEIAADDSLRPPEGAAWQLGRHLRLVVLRAQRPQRSDLYLFYLPGYRVKLRSTFDETAQRRQELEAFAAELVPALVAGERLAPPLD